MIINNGKYIISLINDIIMLKFFFMNLLVYLFNGEYLIFIRGILFIFLIFVLDGIYLK